MLKAAVFAPPSVRVAPHNLEAEQALLGAILVNNDAFDRVSDFLLPEHFQETRHSKIYEICASLIRSGKLASTVTVKTFLNDLEWGDVNPAKYLARLASEATSIINVGDNARAIYDLAVRRQLIRIGEDIVNTAYYAPVDLSPRTQIEETERNLYQVAESGRADGGFQSFGNALNIAMDNSTPSWSLATSPDVGILLDAQNAWRAVGPSAYMGI
ncbi:hypothetical protein DYH55_19200 [Methylovirgula sp. 4M-Z18]|nr:hypothetical protein DYH55_19200 [Methylovirgula sp. 4M-Z18]